MLLGSSVLPPTFRFADGSECTLGDVVRAAFELSLLSIEKWNAMDALYREYRLVDELYRMRAKRVRKPPRGRS